MLPILFISAASAAGVSGGVQIATFQSGLDFVEERLSGQTFEIVQDVVNKADVACYDEVGLRDLNIEIPIQRLDLDLRANSLEIDIFFGLIHGEGMSIYGDDSDIFDVCPSFETDFNRFELRDGRFLIEVVPSLSDGGLELEILGNPTVTGSISTDIGWVPDDLILTFAEDAIFEAIEDAVAERLPLLAAGLVSTAGFAGELGDIGFEVELSDLDTSSTALALGMDVDAEWRGDSCAVPSDIGAPQGRSVVVDLTAGEKADLAVGITEYQVNRLFHGAWADGLLCFDAGPLSGIVESLESILDGTVKNAEAELEFRKAPVFSIGSDGITLRIDDLYYALRGQVDGQELTILSSVADLAIGVEVQVDHSVSSFVLSLTGVELELSNFEADAVIEDDDQALGAVEALIEGWAMETLPERLNDVPLYGNLFYASGIYLRVIELQAQEGALVIKGDLYDEDDPEVDIEAPVTVARLKGGDESGIVVEVGATDNTNGPFAYSLRLDSGEWSDWSDETLVILETPDPGDHIISVRARDAWLNVDPTPVALSFTVEVAPAEDKRGCACAATGRPVTALWAGLWVVMMGLLRRRE